LDLADNSQRLVERCIVLLAKAIVALAFVVTAYGILVAGFFFCCGTNAFSFAHPAKSPLGPLVTILLVWPVGGFLCLILQGALEILLDAVGKGTRRLIGGTTRSGRR
jgi:hypothetical protein